MRSSSTHSLTPLAATIDRLNAIYGEHARLSLGSAGVERGERWLQLSDVLDTGLDALFADVGREAGGRRDYAGATVAALLADALVSVALPPMLLDRRLPDVDPANIEVRRHETHTWFDRIALRSARCLALPDDPARDHPDVTIVADLDHLHQRLARTLVAAVGPWFVAVRGRASFGRRGMWGQLADEIGSAALWVAREAGIDQRAAWEEAHAVLDHLAAATDEMRVRPRPFPVHWSGGETLFQIKGTCCLWYVSASAAEYDEADRYCSACPLRDDESRSERLSSWLEKEAAAAG